MSIESFVKLFLSFKATPSDLGLSPSHTTKDSGRLCSPSSRTLGKGPSGAPAATLFSVNSSFSQSCFNFSRSSYEHHLKKAFKSTFIGS